MLKPIHGPGAGASRSARGIGTRTRSSRRHDDGRHAVVVQRYLPEVRQGDRRILLLTASPSARSSACPGRTTPAATSTSAGAWSGTSSTRAIARFCAALSPRLRADGLWFVGIDVIGEWLTEINVTSPTGVRSSTDSMGETRSAGP